VSIDQSIASRPSLRRLLWLRSSFASLALLADPDVDEMPKKVELGKRKLDKNLK